MQEVGEADAFGHRHKANVGEALAEELRRRTGIETLASELTYDLRSGEPDSVDSMVATTFANVAMDLIADGVTGRMVAIRDGKYATRPCPTRPSGRARSTSTVMYNAERFRPRYDGKLATHAPGRPRLLPASALEPAESRPATRTPGVQDASRRGRTGRGSSAPAADMSSSPWPSGDQPGLELGGERADRQDAPSWRGELEGDAQVLAVERDLEPERVVVVDHPAAAVGQHPALGRAATERADDLLDVEPGLDGEHDAFGDAEIGARRG